MYINLKEQTTDLNMAALYGFNKFLEEYAVIANYQIDELEKKPHILGKKEFLCRYCGKGKPQTSFRNRAHVLPEFIGNASLLCHYECDHCNNRFGRELESHFANFMQLNHTMYAVKGRNGFPKFKLADGTEIKSDGQLIKWDGIPNDKLKVEDDGRKLIATQRVPSFVPVAVYKALVKIAFSIMPKEELPIFKETMAWLNEPIKDSSDNVKPLWVLFGTINSKDRFPDIRASLLKRRILDFEMAPLILRLNYGNFQFDVSIPLFNKGEILPLKQMPYFPNLFDLRDGYGKFDLRFIDFSNTRTLTNQSMTFELVDVDGTGTFETISV